MSTQKIYIMVFSTLSFIFLGIGIWLYMSKMELLNKGLEAEGEIIELTLKSNKPHSAKMYFPVIAFKLENGNIHQKQMSFGSNPAAYDIGQKVSVLYYKDKPETAIINSTFWMYIFPWIFIGLGILLEVILIIILVFQRNR
ncbi:MAG: DUF3592 domain-containing protein [Saprospiraceae bacterium]|nr:DUF3592 domain-containing protein [Saprospiraceae bacterium]